MRTSSLSAAADQLGMTQPAVSQTIGKLRIYFNDQLFIRTGRGTRPTERATAMLEAVEEVLQIIRERIDSCAVFDPAISDRVFTFISTDFGAAVFLPALTAELQRSAPGVRVRPVAANTQTMKAQLESGEVDLAVGGFNDLIAGLKIRVSMVRFRPRPPNKIKHLAHLNRWAFCFSDGVSDTVGGGPLRTAALRCAVR